MRRARALAAAERVTGLLILPLRLALELRVVRFLSVGQMLSLLPGQPGVLVRRAWYATTLERCGRHLAVEFGSVIHRREARIGDDCYIGEYNRIGLVEIGDGFMSATHVSITSGMRQHGTERSEVPMRLQAHRYERVRIGEDVWVGAGAVVGCDVAAHTVVAAGAVVTKRFGEWLLLAGVPAQPARER